MAEKMRYGSNENESGNVDDEFNNANEELNPEDIYRVYKRSRRSRRAVRRRMRSCSGRFGVGIRRRGSV